VATSGEHRVERTECEQRVRKVGGGEEVDGKQSGVEGRLKQAAAQPQLCFSLCVTWVSFREAGKCIR